MRALHLVTGGPPGPLAEATIARQVAAGDAVTVVLLGEAGARALPPEVTVERLDGRFGYAELLDLVLGADQVTAW
jgi:hypothetical protein